MEKRRKGGFPAGLVVRNLPTNAEDMCHKEPGILRRALSCTSINCLSVLSQAPSLVIAKAVEILRGDRKMLSLLFLESAKC